jgi:hypothetical protein
MTRSSKLHAVIANNNRVTLPAVAPIPADAYALAELGMRDGKWRLSVEVRRTHSEWVTIARPSNGGNSNTSRRLVRDTQTIASFTLAATPRKGLLDEMREAVRSALHGKNVMLHIAGSVPSAVASDIRDATGWGDRDVHGWL